MKKLFNFLLGILLTALCYGVGGSEKVSAQPMESGEASSLMMMPGEGLRKKRPEHSERNERREEEISEEEVARGMTEPGMEESVGLNNLLAQLPENFQERLRDPLAEAFNKEQEAEAANTLASAREALAAWERFAQGFQEATNKTSEAEISREQLDFFGKPIKFFVFLKIKEKSDRSSVIS